MPVLYLLAIGSPGAAIPPKAWYAWSRPPMRYGSYSYVGDAPLFTHQYPQAWLDLRGLRGGPPSNLNYFANSVTATRAHRAFCINLARRFPRSYSPKCGASPRQTAPRATAAGAAPAGPGDGRYRRPLRPRWLAHVRAGYLPARAKAMRQRFGATIWGRYGFCDAFNPTINWTDTGVIGIDAGITLLSAENLRTGAVWRWFVMNAEIGRALRLAGFRKTSRR